MANRNYLFALVAGLLLVGCNKDTSFNGKEVTPSSSFFDFNTSKTCVVDINYGFKDYMVVFELYAENPVSVDNQGNSVKTTQEPLYRGSTNANGVFSETISVPSFVNELYLYSDYIGAISPIELSMVNGKVSYNQSDYIRSSSAKSASRGVTNAGYSYPEGYGVLGEWDSFGRPLYLSAEPTNVDPQVLYDLRTIFIERGGSANIGELYPDYVADDIDIKIDIVKPTKISLLLIYTSASMQNSFGYFAYPSDEKPTSASQFKHTIAFPRISTAIYNNPSMGGGIYTGTRVDLKYWDGNKYVDEFPAGVSIGWFLIQTSYNNGNVTSHNKKMFYSVRDLNPNREHRTVALKNSAGRVVTVGLEDANLSDSRNGNFGDALFYLDFSEDIVSGGIGDLPVIPIDTTKIYTSFNGVLSFEDLWPSSGDYDMNDLVVEYNRKIHKSILNSNATKIVDIFTPRHKGGSTENGFGYQLTGISASNIKSVTVKADGVVSKFMNGQSLEPGQNFPTVMLFDNFEQVRGKSISVTWELQPDAYRDLMLTPFIENSYYADYKYNFNPFIVAESNKGRGREIHVVKTPPTSKMDISLFATKGDASRLTEGLYYVNKENLPTGLHIRGALVGSRRGVDFIVPDEGVSVLTMYPDFKEWAESFGSKKTGWWRNPKK